MNTGSYLDQLFISFSDFQAHLSLRQRVYLLKIIKGFTKKENETNSRTSLHRAENHLKH
jgi:hypothetical protein